MTRLPSAPRERDFQRSVMELAELSGWETLHCRTSMQQGRYLTATTGTMAKGWPDLVLVHPKKRRLIFAELKGERGRLTADQGRVMELLSLLEPYRVGPIGPGIASADFTQIRVRVWRPSDWPDIEATLTFRERSAA